MRFYEVSTIGIVGKDFLVLTYSFDQVLPAGTIVEIPVGQRKFVGVILKKVAQPDFECKGILRVLFDTPLPPTLLKLHAWISEFYNTHPSTVWQTMLPSGLNKKRHTNNNISSSFAGLPGESSESIDPPNKSADDKAKLLNNREFTRTNFVFTPDQLSAIDRLVRMKSGTAILRGVTGSGKTAVYKSLALHAKTNNCSAMILVPEISLTAQLVDEFRADFDNVILTHSGQTEAQRAAAWTAALTADKPIVIIGPRSALFMPVKNLGLIVIDECHEPSYKQEKAPRYNALRAAAKLTEFSTSHRPSLPDLIGQSSEKRMDANDASCKLILGSATPLIADVYTAEKLGRPIVEMNNLARPNAQKPITKIVDLTQRTNFSSRSRIFSKQLLTAMQNALDNNKQVLLFHNRRGSASTTLCENCGWIAICPRCFLPLTLHADKFELRCHICNFKQKPPTKCPDCGSTDILHKGLGTKKVEEEVKRLFPDKTVRRFDGDTVRGQAVQDVFAELKNGQTDIIIGTQTVAKGLDLPNLALVGIVQADAGLMLPDFSSNERTFQLIAQACGRVGRGHEQSTVIVQTFQPEHPAVVFGAAQNYADFYNYEISNHQRGHFPPFAYLLKLTCTYKTENGAINAATKLVDDIQRHCEPREAIHDNKENPGSPQRINSPRNDNVYILGPAPAFYERMRDTYRWQIVVRSARHDVLKQIAAHVTEQKTARNWTVELDPNSLI